MQKNLIEVRDLVKTYVTPAGDFTAVKGLDVDVQSGEFVAIIGKSGSGKSTFINMLTGIDRPTSGRIVIDGAPIHEYSEAQMAAWRGRKLGIVFQFFQLLPTLTILENIILPMELNNLYSKVERRERAMQLLEKVDMAGQAHKLPAAISGGQQQRVAIARALANDPPLIVADEPTGNLDSKTAEKIFTLFEDLVAAGKTILMVTHDSDLARRANRTIVISDGEIVNEYLVRALSTLTQDQLVDVARRVKPQVYPRDSFIIREGEVGDKFYILVDGRVDVLMSQPGGGQIVVNQLHPGNYFGEMALLGGGIRTASVKSASEGDARVIVLDGKAFNALIKESSLLREELTNIIERRVKANQVKSLSSKINDDLRAVVRESKPKSHPAGSVVIHQGELGESFYLIEDGRVDVLIRHGDEEIKVNTLKSGQYFGEMALLGDKRRSATVRVSQSGPALLVELSMTEFEKLFARSTDFREKVKKETARRKQGLEKVGRLKVKPRSGVRK
ncbi:MAG: cyclic nucleotide-binding domain-containing protein [Chloroflexi bacterium]|nr:cyclic nucleotide-binding domain-containing protein [Chloroflexota bacterium]